IRPDGDGHLEALPALLGAVVVEAPALADLPVHPGGPLIVDVHAVDAEVALPRPRVLGEHQAEGDEAAAVLGPELEVGKRLEVRGSGHLLSRPARRSEERRVGKEGRERWAAEESERKKGLENVRRKTRHVSKIVAKTRRGR